MGSIVHLALGPFEVDWGKNNNLRLHGELFQPGDITEVPDVYVDDDGQHVTKMQPGASKPLSAVLPRLELLGFTLESVRHEFESLIKSFGNDELPVAFEELSHALKCMELESAVTEYHDDYDLGEFFAREILDRLGFGKHLKQEGVSRYAFAEVMENLHPYAILRMLAENPENLARPVTWH